MDRQRRHVQLSLLTTSESKIAQLATSRPAAAEFFAGIGLVRLALADVGIDVVWANDIEPVKKRLYAANFHAGHYQLGDVRDVIGSDLPDIDLATASFPCTDLSLAGWRRGLAGKQSGMFWEFTRVLDEMPSRRPRALLLENVPGFITSHGGRDLVAAVERLNDLGYWCDLLLLDASVFVPQSRPRLFILGSMNRIADPPHAITDTLRPRKLIDFALQNPSLMLQALPLVPPSVSAPALGTVVERFDADDPVWWDENRAWAFTRSLSALQADRMRLLSTGDVTWRTAYRRTRRGVATWEIRADDLAGCLRTARGGSSKQAVVEGGLGSARVRWMTAREYARLQGAPDTFRFGGSSPNQVMFGFGDAVCVPVVSWIARTYLKPLLAAGRT